MNFSNLSLRHTEQAVEPLFVQRRSIRAFNGNAMPETDLRIMMEAARWAPSAYNSQPWRFLYAQRDDALWATLLELLDPFNADWAKQASALVFLLSHKQHAGQSLPCHRFDAGAAWMSLALQATALGYQAHAMAGLLFDKAIAVLSIPDDMQLHIAIAVGKPGPVSVLNEQLQAREQPSQRLPLEQLLYTPTLQP